ncbi:GAF domain-containing sensor histidine kinase [Thalassovita taeanensis]|uniref:GAF domain-containing sensor histidine kinase n=1 Tax=Thalassovita taeanensis TaxID=657014 RepID=UPI001C31C6B3|nr:GAF domain-containing sensor histidine kinase [Thalassovita taeanensis]
MNDIAEPVFDLLTDAVRQLFDCPIAHISLVEEKHQWFKSVVGIELPEIPRDQSFCTHAIMSDDLMVIPDFTKDPRFVDHPLVANEPNVRFYAGAPIILSSGFRVGSLCALDLVPHAAPSEASLNILRTLANAVAAALERELPDAARQADEISGGRKEFLALIRHELLTPLTVIFGYTGLLEARLVDAPEGVMARAARRSCQHLRELIETVIAFSDVSTGDLALNQSHEDLRQVLDEALEILGPGLDGKAKTVRITQFSVPDPVYIDRSQIKLALTALIENAALHGGDHLDLSAQISPEGHIEISITDDGQLGAEVDLDALYRPFVVGGSLNTRKVGGLGLGLPLTRKIVELHGGELDVIAEDASTLALIRLPAWRANFTPD